MFLFIYFFLVGSASVKINLHNLFFYLFYLTFSCVDVGNCEYFNDNFLIFLPNEGINLLHHHLLPFTTIQLFVYNILITYWEKVTQLFSKKNNVTHHRWSPFDPLGKNCDNFSWRFDCYDNNVDCGLYCFSYMCIIQMVE